MLPEIAACTRIAFSKLSIVTISEGRIFSICAILTACLPASLAKARRSGLGNIIGPALEKSGLPLILIAFFIAILVRASVGSSIVAMTMASGIMATMPAVMDTSMLYRAAMCCAICGGATALSHVNDAGFWLVGTFLEIDEKTTLKSWTIMETLIGVTALIVSLVISIFA